MRTVTVFSTIGGVKQEKFETDVKTWGELKPLIEKKFNLDKLVATEVERKVTLEHKDVELLDTDFRIFLRQKETKSGNLEGKSFKELRAILADKGDNAKQFLTEKFGKNWTTLSGDELRKGLTEYSEPKDSKKEEIVEEKLESEEITETMTPKEKVQKAINLLSEVCKEVNDEEICERTELLIEDAQGLLEVLPGQDPVKKVKEEKDVESEEERKKREAKEEEERKKKEEEERKRKEEEELNNLGKDMMEGF